MQTQQQTYFKAAQIVLAFACVCMYNSIFNATTGHTMQIYHTDGGVVYTNAKGNTLEAMGEYAQGEVHVNGVFYAYYSVDDDNALTLTSEDGAVLHTLADVADEDGYEALAASILQ